MYDNALPLGADLREAHDAALKSICQPGPSWTGAERRAMVESARAATSCHFCAARKSALAPSHVSGDHDDPTDLPAIAVDAIHRIRTDPARLTRAWFDEVTAAIGQPAYVELVSVVNSSVIIDTLHSALEQPLPALAEAEPGQPTRAETGDVVDEGAWLPISRAPRDMADTGLPAVPNIFRAMGLVPDAVALFFSTFRPHYALKDISLSLSQAQAELVASRVSAWNECFYWTTSHTMLLRASGEKESADYDLTAVTDRSRNSGVPHGELLTALAEQTAGSDWQTLKATLQEAIEAMGEQQAVDALVVASAFNGITRVADATGIPLDENTAETTVEMRNAVGLNDYQYSAKSERYGWKPELWGN